MAAALARLSACRSEQFASSIGPSWPQRSRSGVAITAIGFFDLKELGPGLPLTAVSDCATAPNSERACMGPSTSHRTGFVSIDVPRRTRLLGSSPGNDNEGQY